eukprot:5464013-Amphidinium_carterae.1
MRALLCNMLLKALRTMRRFLNVTKFHETLPLKLVSSAFLGGVLVSHSLLMLAYRMISCLLWIAIRILLETSTRIDTIIHVSDCLDEYLARFCPRFELS